MPRRRKQKKFRFVPLGTMPFVLWDKEGKTFEGVYQGSREVKLKEGAQERVTFIHDFASENGITGIWDSTVLSRIRSIPKGTMVRIVYKGKAGKGRRKYNDFDILVPEGTKIQGPATPF